MAKPAVPRFLVLSVCWENSTEAEVRDARDGRGRPVRRAGSQGPPNTGEGRSPQGIYTHLSPPEVALPGLSFCSSYIHTCARGYVEAAVLREDVDDLKVLLFASRTGYEQRTLERPPSFQAVLRYAQSTTPGPLPL